MKEAFGMFKWKATVYVGVFVDLGNFTLTTGPEWWCKLRAKWHLFLHPMRAIQITKIA
jgi:hypothetical protein